MKKSKTTAFVLASCVLLILMLAGCLSTGSSTLEEEATPAAKSPHMQVIGCKEGLKITLSNVQNGDIRVYEGNDKLPVSVEIFNAKSVYIFPFTENGTEYTVIVHGTDSKTDRDFGEEKLKCVALGGKKFSDCIDLSKIDESEIVGSIKDDGKFYVKLANTQIKNTSDIIKDSSVSDSSLEYVLIIGGGNWWSGIKCFMRNVSGPGSLGKWLTKEKEIPTTNWGRSESIPIDKIFAYQFLARLNICYSENGVEYDEKFYTEGIRSQLYYNSLPTENVVIKPSLTVRGAVPKQDNKTNWIHTQDSSGGGEISLADYDFELSDGGSQNYKWDSFNAIEFIIEGGCRDGEDFNIIVEGNNPSGSKFEKDLGGVYTLKNERVQETITVLVEDIIKFKNNNNITDESLKLFLRTGDNADFGVYAMSFK